MPVLPLTTDLGHNGTGLTGWVMQLLRYGALCLLAAVAGLSIVCSAQRTCTITTDTQWLGEHCRGMVPGNDITLAAEGTGVAIELTLARNSSNVTLVITNDAVAVGSQGWERVSQTLLTEEAGATFLSDVRRSCSCIGDGLVSNSSHRLRCQWSLQRQQPLLLRGPLWTAPLATRTLLLHHLCSD